MVLGLCGPPLKIEPHATTHHLLEPKPTSLRALVAELASALAPLCRERPYALLGHSMGAWVTFELARALAALRPPVPPPRKVYVSANRAPHLAGGAHDPDRDAPELWRLDDGAFWRAFERRYGANPDLQVRACGAPW